MATERQGTLDINAPSLPKSGGAIQSITGMDGFGRVLQTKQQVEPGRALRVDAKGFLILGPDGKPLEEEVPDRWRVSEPVEYNKGEANDLFDLPPPAKKRNNWTLQ